MSKRDAPHLFVFLTREEFRLCWILAFMESFEEYRGTFPLERYATPGKEGKADDWGEEVRRAARYLHFECEYDFSDLDFYEDGRIIPKGPPVEPRNQAYLHMFMAGSIPDPERAATDSIAWARHNVPRLDYEPIAQFCDDITKEKARVQAELNPEHQEEILHLRKRALDKIGIAVGEVN